MRTYLRSGVIAATNREHDAPYQLTVPIWLDPAAHMCSSGHTIRLHILRVPTTLLADGSLVQFLDASYLIQSVLTTDTQPGDIVTMLLVRS